MVIGIDAKTLSKRKTGIAFYVLNIIKYLNNIDDKNTYILYSNKKIDVPFKLKKNFVIKYYKAKIASIAIYYKLPKILKKDKVDLFWGSEHILPKKSKHYKMVVTIHDLAFAKFKGICTYNNLIIQGLFAKKSCRNADKVIAISKATKQDIIELYHIKEDKITVIYNGESPYIFSEELKNTEDYKLLCKKFGIDKDYLFFVGAIEPRKNIINMVSAFEKYKDEFDSDIKFVIAGGAGWKTEPIFKKINESKYRDDIILTDYVTAEEKENLYRNAKALFFVSLYEGFGLPILEALSLGVPVITSKISSMPEVGGDCCYYVNNPADVDEICNVLSNAIHDIETETVDRQALIIQSQKYSMADCAMATLKLFGSVMGK